MDFLTRANIVLIFLGICFLLIVIAFWRAHRARGTDFDIIDLVMQDGKVSRIGTAYMITLLVSSWVIIDMQVKGALTEIIFGAYLTAWVAPLVTRVVKGQAPGSSAPGATPEPE